MSSEGEQTKDFWKDLPKSIDYFSPAITKIQDYAGVDTASILKNMGKQLGEKVAEKNRSLSFEEFLKMLSQLWDEWKIGKLEVESLDPLVFYSSGCVVCGQLPEMGGQFKCNFHEGFFEAALSSKLGRQLKIRQSAAYRGDAGTWSRRYEVQ